jgi:hypothetical protein
MRLPSMNKCEQCPLHQHQSQNVCSSRNGGQRRQASLIRSHLCTTNCLQIVSYASDVILSDSSGTLVLSQFVQTPTAGTVPSRLAIRRLGFGKPQSARVRASRRLLSFGSPRSDVRCAYAPRSLRAQQLSHGGCIPVSRMMRCAAFLRTLRSSLSQSYSTSVPTALPRFVQHAIPTRSIFQVKSM